MNNTDYLCQHFFRIGARLKFQGPSPRVGFIRTGCKGLPAGSLEAIHYFEHHADARRWAVVNREMIATVQDGLAEVIATLRPLVTYKVRR